MLIGNPLKINETLYKMLLERAEIAELNIENDPIYKKNLRVID
jgi:hypothetical protein